MAETTEGRIRTWRWNGHRLLCIQTNQTAAPSDAPLVYLSQLPALTSSTGPDPENSSGVGEVAELERYRDVFGDLCWNCGGTGDVAGGFSDPDSGGIVVCPECRGKGTKPETDPATPEPQYPLVSQLRAELHSEGAALVVCAEVSGLSPENREDVGDVQRALVKLFGPQSEPVVGDWKARAEKAEADLERLELANDDAADFAAVLEEEDRRFATQPEPQQGVGAGVANRDQVYAALDEHIEKAHAEIIVDILQRRCAGLGWTPDVTATALEIVRALPATQPAQHHKGEQG